MSPESDDQETDRAFDEYVRRASAMYRRTKNHLVNSYWQSLSESGEKEFLPFVIRGSLQWESESRERLRSADDSAWLLSRNYDPAGRHISEEPVRLYLQWHLGLYEVWGGLSLPVVPDDATLAQSVLGDAIGDISLLTSLAALLTGASLQWLPARWSKVTVVSVPPGSGARDEYEEWRCQPFRRSEDEAWSTVVHDEFVSDRLLVQFGRLRNAKPEVRGLFDRATAWHASGNFRGSGSNRFLNYWSSIELLAGFFYRKSRMVARETRASRQAKIMAILDGVTGANCLEKVQRCSEVLKPSTKQKVTHGLSVLFGSEIGGEELFDKKSGRSLYDVRNDIAHGNGCDHETEFQDAVSNRLDEIRRISHRVILAALQRFELVETHGDHRPNYS